MNNFENDVFSFGSNDNENLEQATNFNYDSISGLGESNYENEDLFKVEGQNNLNNTFNNNISMTAATPANVIETPQTVQNLENIGMTSNDLFNNDIPTTPVSVEPIVQNTVFNPQVVSQETPTTLNTNMTSNDLFNDNIPSNTISIDTATQNNIFDTEILPQEVINFDTPVVNSVVNEPQFNNLPVVEEPLTVNNTQQEVPNTTEETETYQNEVSSFEEQSAEENINEINQTDINTEKIVEPQYEEELDEDEIFMSETPIEELKGLTKYEEDYIEQTDINSLFNKVSVNVQDASDIFRKNTDMKAKIDTRFEELRKLQSEMESKKQQQIEEINSYKEDVLSKLTEKKEEIEKRLNTLKEYQANLEKQKADFEKYKRNEQANIDKIQKEVQAAYDDRREELSNIEDALRRQKDALDEERNQLSLDRIQYESDKNELANNLLKFNELVNSFTNGVNDANRE